MLKEVFNRQRKEGGSLIAFNVQNITHLQVLRECVGEAGLPVIAQFSARYVPYWEERIGLSHLVRRYQENGVYFHLDHCQEPEIIRQCIDAGIAGVMFDGSSLPVEENIRVTNEMAEHIRRNAPDIVLEAELGTITGVEDGVEGSETADYYLPEELERMVEQGTFDLLALAIGNAHGVYESTDPVKPELLREATERYPELKLVLHGGSGLPKETVRECIGYGVVKINISTELKLVTQKALVEYGKRHEAFNENLWHDHAQEFLKPFFRSYITEYTKA